MMEIGLLVLVALVALAALGATIGSALKARTHRMAVDRRLAAIEDAVHAAAEAADRRADDLLARIEALGRLENRLRVLEARDLAAEWQRRRHLSSTQLQRLTEEIDRLRDDLRLEVES